VAAVASGFALRFAVELKPEWWHVWLAPVPLLVMAIRLRRRDARWMVPLAAAIGASVNFGYYRLVMPLLPAVLAVAGQAVLWMFLAMAGTRLVKRYRAWWTVFAYPVLWAAADTLMAALLPDGNWGSLAYSQGDRRVFFEALSLFGTPGLVFLISLVPATLAVMIACHRKVRGAWIAYAITAALLGAAVLYGWQRLRIPVTGTEMKFGLVSIDDPIGPKASAAYAEPILNEYVRRIGEVAGEGAHVVVLPEKVEVVRPERESGEVARWSGAAKANRVWLEVGVGIDDGASPTNWAWLFSPDGTLKARYQKHYMAPPERRENYASGHEYSVVDVDGAAFGLAVCKDMHFASLGREYGRRGAAVMLIPAWDFDYLDGWLEARTTVARGIENGYAVVRASREGLLTVSGPYGRVRAEMPSGVMPGRSMVVGMPVMVQAWTLYTRIGNLFGWICVAVGVVFLGMGRRRGSRSQGEQKAPY
jgi:apolipoprotein N-acyltransferase